MASQRSHTVLMNLVLLFCLVAVMNNVVTARELNKNPSDHEKGVNNNAAAAEDPSNNKEVDKNNLLFGIPYTLLPLPISFRGFPYPVPIPIPAGRTFPNMLIPPDEYNFPGAGGAPSLDRVPTPPSN